MTNGHVELVKEHSLFIVMITLRTDRFDLFEQQQVIDHFDRSVRERTKNKQIDCQWIIIVKLFCQNFCPRREKEKSIECAERRD